MGWTGIFGRAEMRLSECEMRCPSLMEGHPGVCGSPAPFKTDPKRTPSPREDEIVLLRHGKVFVIFNVRFCVL